MHMNPRRPTTNAREIIAKWPNPAWIQEHGVFLDHLVIVGMVIRLSGLSLIVTD